MTDETVDAAIYAELPGGACRRGNFDNWDPALIDAPAAGRRVITFDNVGVGATTAPRRARSRRWPTAPSPSSGRGSSSGWICSGSRSGASWLRGRGHPPRPRETPRARLFRTAAGMHGWAPEVVGAVGAPQTRPEGYLSVFFAPTETSLGGKPQNASSAGRSTSTSRPLDGPARLSTTRFARGGFPIIRCSSESRRSTFRCSSRAERAIR
jgi:hypothetical protein